MRQRFTVPGRLEGFNEYTDACRRSAHAGAAMKREQQDIVGWAIRAARLKPMAGKVDVHFRWYEPNMKRDKDNIVAAKKFILDALVEQGIIRNDNWTYVGDFSDKCFLSRNNPRIEIELEEV